MTSAAIRAVVAATVACGAIVAGAPPAAAAVHPAANSKLVASGAHSQAVAYNPRRDEYLVTYSLSTGGGDGRPTRSLVRRLDRTGAPRGGPKEVALTPWQAGPLGQKLVYNATRDEYLLLWVASAQEYGEPYVIHGLRLGAGGTPIGDPRLLLGPEDQSGHKMRCCGDVTAVHEPDSDGYLITWRASTAVLGPHHVMGRRVDATLGLGAVRQLFGDTHVIRHDVVRSGRGYLVAAWGTDRTSYGLRTRYVDAAGQARGGRHRVNAPNGGGLALASNPRGLIAVGWNTPADGLVVQGLDRLGRPRGGTTEIPYHEDYRQTSPTSLSYNPAADRFLLSWNGYKDHPTDEDEVLEQAAVATLPGDLSGAAGAARAVAGDGGPILTASTRERRWLALLNVLGDLRSRTLGP